MQSSVHIHLGLFKWHRCRHILEEDQHENVCKTQGKVLHPTSRDIYDKRSSKTGTSKSIHKCMKAKMVRSKIAMSCQATEGETLEVSVKL